MGRVGEVPQPDLAIVAADGQDPVPAERHRADIVCGAGQGLAEQSGVGRVGEVPQPDLAVLAAGGQGPPVRAERHRSDIGCGAGQGRAELDGVGRVGEVPQPDCVVVGAGGQGPPVRAERHRVDTALGGGQGLSEPGGLGTVGEVPQPDLVVAAAGGQGPPVRAERHRADNVCGAGQRPGQQGAGGIKQLCFAVRRGAELVGNDVKPGGERRVGGGQLADLKVDLVRDCLVAFPDGSIAFRDRCTAFPDRRVALTVGDEAGHEGECSQYGQQSYCAPGETHRTPVLPQMLADQLVLRHAPDRGCHGSNTVGRNHGLAAIELHVTQINPKRHLRKRAAQCLWHRGISGPVLFLLVPRQARAGSDDKQPVW